MDQAAFRIGLEEECQLVDRATGELRGRAPAPPDDAGSAWRQPGRPPREPDRPVSARAAEAVERLVERRDALSRLAAPEGMAPAAAGLHPTAPDPGIRSPAGSEPGGRGGPGTAPAAGPDPDDRRIFTLRIRIAVPSREAAVRAMAGTTPFIPHLLIPTASSPFHQGIDTGFHSFRTLLRDMAPRAGPAPPIATAGEYARLERILAQGPGGTRHAPIAWDIRPDERLGAVEFRLFDAIFWIDAIEVVAAMARALTAVFADRPAPQWTGTELQLLRENRWRAARFGFDAELHRLDPVTGETRRARDVFIALAERLAPVAERLGDGAALARVATIAERGTPATAMREVLSRTGSLPEVTRWVAEQTAVGWPA